VREAGVGEPAGGGAHGGCRGDLHSEVVERGGRAGVLEEHQLQRGVGDNEVRIARSLLGRLDPEHVGIEPGGRLDVGDVECELDAAGGHRELLRVLSPPVAETTPVDEATPWGTHVRSSGPDCVHHPTGSSSTMNVAEVGR